MGLEVGCLPGDVSVGCRVGFIEAVAGKIDHEVENFVGDFIRNVILPRPFEEVSPLGYQNRLFLLAHGPTQQVSLTEREAA